MGSTYRRLIAFPLIAGVLFAAPAAWSVSVLGFDEVEPGMKGVGHTVFRGTEVETFDVEVLGKLAAIGPDQNLILVRLTGGPLAETGVIAGMSGSPVLIDGRLIGAVAYGWGFSKEAIAGVTPIEEMLRIAEIDEPADRPAAALPRAVDLEGLASPGLLAEFFAERWRSLLPAGGWPQSVPLSVSGFSVVGLGRVLPQLRQAGFWPLRSGSAAGRGDAQVSPPLRPGSAVGLRLVGGDVEMTATGTVTWVDDDRVLAFGHPIFSLGAIDLPMTAARVEALLPSVHQSLRMATPTAEIGALRQDRASGVMGRIGAKPRTIPVRMQLTGGSADERSYRFDLADDPLLSPLLLYVSLTGILAGNERPYGNATIRLREGSVIKMLDSDDIELDNLFAGPSALEMGSGLPAYVLYLVLNNVWGQPQIAGVNLLFDYDTVPRTGRIRRVSLDRYRVAPGGTVEVTVVLGAYRGADRAMRHAITIPPETTPGPITIIVGSALEASRSVGRSEPLLPRDLDQLIRLINQLRRNDNVYIVATRSEAGVSLSGERLPNLPPSVATVLSRPPRGVGTGELIERSILEEVVPTEFVVEGSARIGLNVEAP
jgi:hypothetical protein